MRSRIMNYDCPLAQYNLYTLIPFYRFYEIILKLRETREKENRDASRMKKNDPTLTTWDTLVVGLQQLRNPRRKSALTVRD